MDAFIVLCSIICIIQLLQVLENGQTKISLVLKCGALPGSPATTSVGVACPRLSPRPLNSKQLLPPLISTTTPIEQNTILQRSKMGSDPQFSKFPNLALAQNIFAVANSPQNPQTSLQYIQDAIKTHKMAPLYRHLAHPTEGVLNTKGEGTAASATTSTPTPPARRGSLVSSNLLPSRRSLSSGLIPWDEKLYEELKADNEKELEEIQKEEEEAQEKAGETEVQAARGKRAEFWARVGDKVRYLYINDVRWLLTNPVGQINRVIRSSIRQDRPSWYQDRHSPRHNTNRSLLQ